MKRQDYIKYLLYGIIILILIFLNLCISRLQLEYMKSTYNRNVLYYVVLILIKILIGIVAGLEIFSKELKKEGRLLFNIP